MEEALPGCYSGGFTLRGSALWRRSEVKALKARVSAAPNARATLIACGSAYLVRQFF